LLFIDVSRCTGSNAETFGLENRQLLDMGETSRPSEGSHRVTTAPEFGAYTAERRFWWRDHFCPGRDPTGGTKSNV
jgi:hypothetical protein